MHVRDIMTDETVTVAPDTPVRKVAELMRDKHIGFVPVGKDDKLVGVVTDRDLVIRYVAGEEDAASAKAGDVMTDDLLYCRVSDKVEDVAANMGSQQVRRLPVVDDDKRLVGIVSLGDVADAKAGASGAALHDIAQ